MSFSTTEAAEKRKKKEQPQNEKKSDFGVGAGSPKSWGVYLGDPYK